MEEILASIRRIIADDQATNRDAKPAPAPAVASVAVAPAPVAAPVLAPVPAPVAPPVDDILDLADIAAVSPDLTPAEPISFDEPEPHSDMPLEPEPMIQAPVAAPQPEPQMTAPAPEIDDALVTGASRVAATNAFQTLSRTVLLTNGRTLDDIVAEMMRPMLKEWLDENLPSIVERLVRVEIERVARGR